MLNLLTLEQASLLLLKWSAKINDHPLAPETVQSVLNDPALNEDFWRFRTFLNNAIDAEELPCLKKARGKAEDNRLKELVDAPEDIRPFLPKSYDKWITWDDLTVFAERSPLVSTKVYSHGRDALARLAWVLLKHAGYLDNQKELNEALQEILVNMDVEGLECKLGEVTLKGCIREIHAAGQTISSDN